LGRGPTAGIMLGAGTSSRMGQPKQLLQVGGTPMLLRVLGAAMASPLAHIVLVLGPNAMEVRGALGLLPQGPRLKLIFNEHHTEGMASSIRAGIREIKNDFPSCMLVLGDQPLLDAATIELLLKAFWSSTQEICVPFGRGVRGQPVIFGRRFYEELMALKGDVGGRGILEAHPEEVLEVQVPDPEVLMDVDTPEDLKRVQELLLKRQELGEH